MENNTQQNTNPPAVIGTPAPAAPLATAPVPSEKPIFSARRSAALAVDTIVVTATATALLGAGYGIYRVATKAK